MSQEWLQRMVDSQTWEPANLSVRERKPGQWLSSLGWPDHEQ